MSALPLASLFFLLILAATIGSGRTGAYFNSDVLQAYLVTADMLRDWRTVFTWNHSPALYVFPDWFVALAANLLPVANEWKPLVVGAALMTAHVWLVGLIYATVAQRPRVEGTLRAAALLGLAWTLQLALAPDAYPAELFTYLSSLFIHAGAALGTLVNLVLVARFWDRPLGRAAALGWALFVAALVFSDPILVGWSVLPALGLLAFDASVTRSLARWRLLAVLAGASLPAFLVESALNDIRDQYLATRLPAGQSLAAFASDIRDATLRGDLLIPAILCGCLIAMLKALSVVLACIRTGRVDRRDAFLLLTALSMGSALAVPLAAGLYVTLPHWRYIGVLPLLLTAWIVVLSGRVPALPLKAACAASMAAVAIWSASQMRPSLARLDAMREWAACLETEGGRRGLADYWTTKRAVFLSDGRLSFIQLAPNGTVALFNYNTAWLEPPVEAGAPLDARFIVPTGLETERLVELYGQPSSTRTCGKDTLWYYDAPLTVRTPPPGSLFGTGYLTGSD